MASSRTTVTLDDELSRRARELGINVSAAARRGVAQAVATALADRDRAAYEACPEVPDAFWAHVEKWTDD